jgi:hypothetical protein
MSNSSGSPFWIGFHGKIITDWGYNALFGGKYYISGV